MDSNPPSLLAMQINLHGIQGKIPTRKKINKHTLELFFNSNRFVSIFIEFSAKKKTGALGGLEPTTNRKDYHQGRRLEKSPANDENGGNEHQEMEKQTKVN